MKTDYIVNKISNVIMILLTGISSIAILYLKNIALVFVIAYLWIVTINQNKQYKLKERIRAIIEKEEQTWNVIQLYGLVLTSPQTY